MSENTNAGGRARLTLDLSNKLNEEVDRLAAANGVTKDDVLRFARELLAKKADAALSAQSTGSGGVAAEPVAWAWESPRYSGCFSAFSIGIVEKWSTCLSTSKPKQLGSIRNIRPLYEHPPVAAEPVAVKPDADRLLKDALFACLETGSLSRGYSGVRVEGGRYARIKFWIEEPVAPSPDQNRGEPDQGGANTEAGR